MHRPALDAAAPWSSSRNPPACRAAGPTTERRVSAGSAGTRRRRVARGSVRIAASGSLAAGARPWPRALVSTEAVASGAASPPTPPTARAISSPCGTQLSTGGPGGGRRAAASSAASPASTRLIASSIASNTMPRSRLAARRGLRRDDAGSAASPPRERSASSIASGPTREPAKRFRRWATSARQLRGRRAPGLRSELQEPRGQRIRR